MEKPGTLEAAFRLMDLMRLEIERQRAVIKDNALADRIANSGGEPGHDAAACIECKLRRQAIGEYRAALLCALLPEGN